MTLHLVDSFGRIGEENAFAVLARATELQRAGKDIINLGIGQPDFPTPPHIVEAAVKALRDGAHGYTPATGILPLREAVAAFKLGSAKETLALHEAERWRAELLADDDALTRWMQKFVATDTQQLRSLVRAARRDAVVPEERQPRSHRELFQFIKSAMAGGPAAAGDDDLADDEDAS